MTPHTLVSQVIEQHRAEDSDVLAVRVLDGLVTDRDIALDVARAIAERHGEIEVDHALDPSAAGDHFLSIRFDLASDS